MRLRIALLSVLTLLAAGASVLLLGPQPPPSETAAELLSKREIKDSYRGNRGEWLAMTMGSDARRFGISMVCDLGKRRDYGPEVREIDALLNAEPISRESLDRVAALC